MVYKKAFPGSFSVGHILGNFRFKSSPRDQLREKGREGEKHQSAASRMQESNPLYLWVYGTTLRPTERHWPGQETFVMHEEIDFKYL